MKRVWIVLATGTMMTLAQPGAADVKTGVDAWQQGDYAKAVAEWQPLAEAGDPDAQFNLGQAYKLGRGVKADPDTALQWYRKAAGQGHARAEDNLGLLMFRQGDRAGALPYLERAADRGEPRAQYIVGTALFNGDLKAKDWVRAYALMTRASRSGLAQASRSLQQMDKYIPQDQRAKGIALAQGMAATPDAEPDGGSSVTRPAPAPVRTAEIPASTQSAPAALPRASAPAKPAASVPKAKTAAAPATAKPAPTVAGGGNWRVQIGAFSAESRARSLWSQLRAKVGRLSSYQPYISTSGGITRLQAGPIASSAEASKLCGAIKAAGADCMPRRM